jgi:N-acetylglutamate synthase-like GNAT family acetyltransferase
MHIRPATKFDLRTVLECLRELNKEHVDYFHKNKVKWLLKNKCVAVCESASGEIMGVCIVEDQYDDTFEIFAIAVNPTYQKYYGVGSKLLKWAEAMAIACDREVIFANSYDFYNATPFYEKNGYTRQGEGVYTFFKYLDFPIGHQYTLRF